MLQRFGCETRRRCPFRERVGADRADQMQWEILICSVFLVGLTNFVLQKFDKCSSDDLSKGRRGRAGRGSEVRVVRRVPGRLAEYEASGAEFSVRLWLNLTAGIALLLFGLGLHLQDDWVLVSLLVTLTLALLAKLHFKVKRETLLVESSLGVQLTTVFVGGRRTSLFLARGRLKDVVIAEAVTMHRVVTYLALVQRRPDGLVPLFRHTWPCRAQLEMVYRDIQRILRPEPAVCEAAYCSS